MALHLCRCASRESRGTLWELAREHGDKATWICLLYWHAAYFLCCPWHCAVLCKCGARHQRLTKGNGVLTSTLVSGLERF